MLFHSHSGFRYLVLLAGLVTIGYATYALAKKKPYDKTMKIVSAVFTGVVDLTAVLGFALMLSGVFYPQLGGHIVMMVFAAVVAHIVHGVMKRRPIAERTYVPHIVGTVVVLTIVVFGILAIGRPIVG